GNNKYFRRTGRHIDAHVGHPLHQALCLRNKLVARAEYLVNFGNAVGSVSHGCYCLGTTCKVNTLYLEQLKAVGYKAIDLSALLRRAAHYDFFTSVDPCGHAKHQQGTG